MYAATLLKSINTATTFHRSPVARDEKPIVPQTISERPMIRLVDLILGSTAPEHIVGGPAANSSRSPTMNPRTSDRENLGRKARHVVKGQALADRMS